MQRRTQLKQKTQLRARVPFQSRFSAQGKTRKPLRRKSRQTLAKRKEHLWELCKKITRLRYGNTCYTSGKTNLEGSDWQTGHGKPKGALPLLYKYDLRNLRPQSYHDNINLGGCSDIFIAKLEREPEGLSFLKEACVKIDGRWEIKHIPPMGSQEAREFVEDRIRVYENILSTLLSADTSL